MASTSINPDLFHQTKLEISFVLINNSLVPVASLVPDTSSQTSDVIIVITLSVLLILSVIFNLLVIGTVISSYSLQRLLVYRLLAQLSVVCFLECALNITVSITFVSACQWKLGLVVCSMNSYFMLAVAALISFSVAILVTERCHIVCNPLDYKKQMNRLITVSSIIFALVVIVCAGIFVPVALGDAVSSIPFSQRYSCAPNGNGWQGYQIALFTIFHVLPICFSVFCCFRIIAYLIANWRATRKQNRTRANGGSPPPRLAAAYLWSEMRNIYIVLGLVLGYGVLFLPHVIAVNSFQMTHSPYNLSTTPYEDFLQNLKLTDEEYKILKNYDSQIKHLFDTIYTNATLSASASIVKGVTTESPWETVFIWGRYLFALFVPILLFAAQPEFRMKTYALLCLSWRKNLSPRDGVVMSARPSNRTEIKRQQQKKLSLQSVTSNTGAVEVPVLFSTPDGLFLRILNPDNRTNNEENAFVYVCCDVPVKEEKLEEEIVKKNEEEIKTLILKSKMVRFSPIVLEISHPKWDFLGETFNIEEAESFFHKNITGSDKVEEHRKVKTMENQQSGLVNKPELKRSPKKSQRSGKSKPKTSSIVTLSKKKIPAPDFVKKKSSANNGNQRWYY